MSDIPKIQVARCDPHDAEATALLRASHALMQKLFAEEDNHYLEIDELCAAGIHFFVARVGSETLGCIALAEKEGYGEVKSMFVDDAARGQGVGAALFAHLEDEARGLSLPILRLETGNTLYAAHRLYQRHGFTQRGPFGDYADSPASLFMEKTL